jgi:hypothetical protein
MDVPNGTSIFSQFKVAKLYIITKQQRRNLMTDNVKYKINGVQHFGNIDCYSEEGKEAKSKGEAIVEDCIYPTKYRMKLDQLTFVNWDEQFAFQDAELEKALSVSKAIEGCKPGKLIYFNVADGVAHYVVKKVNKTTVNLEWRGFCPDGYVNAVLGYEGKMDKARCEAQVKFHDVLDSIHGN